MNDFKIPNLNTMNDEEVKMWVESLTTPIVYKHLSMLMEIIMERFGGDASVSTSTFGSPKIVRLIPNVD